MNGDRDAAPECDLVLVLRYRKAVTYGFHVLLGALETHETPVTYQVRFASTVEATIAEIRDGLVRARRVLVLWSFYSPDAAALAAELAEIKTAAPGAMHVAGGVHATAEPAQTLDAGWDVAAVGEGEETLLRLVDAGGESTGVPGLAYRDATGALVRTGRPGPGAASTAIQLGARTTTGGPPAGRTTPAGGRCGTG